MRELFEPSASRRRSVRRAVSLETEVTCSAWDGAVRLRATDLSPHGMWLETALPLDPGDEVSVCISAPGFSGDVPLRATARVARVGLYRRRVEQTESGMGLAFAPLSSPDAERLDRHLRGLPPPLPRASAGAPLPRVTAPVVAAPSECAQDVSAFTLADGSVTGFTAIGPLLTAGRPRFGEPAPQHLADVIPLPNRLPLARFGA